MAMVIDYSDRRILEIIKNNKSLDLRSIKDLFWRESDEDEIGGVNIGERITRLYLKEYIRKSPNYEGYNITRKGRKILEKVIAE